MPKIRGLLSTHHLKPSAACCCADPHLEGGLVMLNFEQAAVHLTERMIRLAKIDHTSTVLDLGCGKGIACQHIAERTGA
eukprot:COSAG01_NODE_63_length_29632_cov_270.650662_3_plen_79_part_00